MHPYELLQPTIVRKGSERRRHVEVRERIYRFIREGGFKLGDSLPNQKELVKILGVSNDTISRALDDLAKEGFIRRVTGQGTFIMDLRPETSKNIGIISIFRRRSNPLDNLIMNVMDGAEEECHRRDHEFITHGACHQAYTDDVQRVPRFILKNAVDGVVLDSWLSNSYVQMIKGIGLPAVLFDRRFDGIPTVMPGTDSAARLVIDYLIARGHRRIGVIGNKLHDADFARYFAAIEYLKQRELYTPELDGLFSGSPWEFAKSYEREVGAKEQTARLVDAGASAIYCTEDWHAMHACTVIRSRGLQVGKDVSIIGFHNMDLAEKYDPPITTVDSHEHEIGAMLISVLDRLIEGEPVATVSTGPVSLVERSTVATLA